MKRMMEKMRLYEEHDDYDTDDGRCSSDDGGGQLAKLAGT